MKIRHRKGDTSAEIELEDGQPWLFTCINGRQRTGIKLTPRLARMIFLSISEHLVENDCSANGTKVGKVKNTKGER